MREMFFWLNFRSDLIEHGSCFDIPWKIIDPQSWNSTQETQ